MTMKKYEEIKIELLLIATNDVVTTSGDPIPPKGNEDVWPDFYNKN